MSDTFSVNQRAEVMGRRRTDVVPFDQPCELGYWCPVCRVVPLLEDGNYDERLHWSEYEGFLWCEICNLDYPSVLCVRLDAEASYPWEQMGVEAAIDVYLRTVETAVHKAMEDQ